MEVAGANGSKSHKTVTIKSPDRRVVSLPRARCLLHISPRCGRTDRLAVLAQNVILTNVGPALTPSMSSGKEEPKAGKVALLTRTVAFNVRSFAASRNTSQEDFKAHMLQPRVQKRVDEFRLLTSLAMFCRLAILRVPSLQPDLGYARVMFRQFDDMLGETAPSRDASARSTC
jgi:hypothetical protein